jgi:hypothetical protein
MIEIVVFSWALAGVALIYIFISRHRENKKRK